MKTKIIFITLLILIKTIAFSQWSQIGTDINGQNQNEFTGGSVSINSEGNIIAIGNFDDNYYKNFNTNNPLPVRIYKHTSNTWQQIGNDIISETVGQNSRNTVCLNSDGNIIVIGNYLNSNNGIYATGSIHIYENISNQWEQIGDNVYGLSQNEELGIAVSINASGDVVASIGTNIVRVFENNSGNWQQIGDSIYTGPYNYSLDLNSTGNILAIGATNKIQVYENNSGVWQQIGGDITEGSNVSINANGNIIAVGDEVSDVNGSFSGQVKIYEYISGDWQQIGNSIDGDDDDLLGASICLNSEGNKLVVGATWYDDSRGKADIYEYNLGLWQQVGNSIYGDTTNISLGIAVAINSDGTKIVIGANKSDDVAIDAGKVKTYSSISTNIDNYSNTENKIDIYPNPTTGEIKINSYYIEKIEVFNTNGILIKSTKTNIIDLCNETRGIYFIKITNKKSSITKMVILE